jgi:exopolysaccharide biosynthesis WecB/TagA/CpsF family protein
MVDLRHFGETIEYISERARTRGVTPLAVTSVNLDHIHHFGVGSRWTGTLDASWSQAGVPAEVMEWLNLVDGAPLATQARRLTGHPWPRLAGSDLIGPLLARAELDKTRIGFLGGAESTHRQLHRELAVSHPALEVSGFWAPSREELWDPERSGVIADAIRAARTDLLVVGLGKPRQELWIAEHGPRTGARVLLAFGAVVDFLAGRISRAPQWMVSGGMEWAWRLALEPRRLASRYLVEDPPAYLAVRRTRGSNTPGIATPGSMMFSATAVDPVPRFVGPGSPANVAAIIVTSNSGSTIGPLLASLRTECEHLRLRVIVTDDGSRDGTRLLLAQESDLIIVESAGARGYSAAVNSARLYIGDADAVLVLKADRVLEPGALQAMVKRMTRSGAGVVVPRLLNADGSTYPSVRREPTLSRAAFDALLGGRNNRRPKSLSEFEGDVESYEHAHQVEWSGGASLLVRRDVYNAVGDWDERFFRFSEETDYFRRVRESGASVWYEPQARFRREPDSASAMLDLESLLAVNKIRYSRKHHSWLYAVAFHAIVTVHAALRFSDPVQRKNLLVLLGGRDWRKLPHAAPALPTAQPVPEPEFRTTFGQPAGAIIIPAHDEENVIARTLALLVPLTRFNYAEIVVVCNGCTDNTALIARRFPGVQVREIDAASKTTALNIGDIIATAWPRLYLDADIELDPQTVVETFEALGTGLVLAVRPAAEYDTVGASALVRSYYRARRRIPAPDGSLWGAGVYAVSSAGHDRFEAFPNLTADDLFIDALFAPTEKAILRTQPVTVRTPRTFAALMAVLTRQHRGKMESGTTSTTLGSVRALLRGARSPTAALDAAVYVMLTSIGRIRARRWASRGVAEWERDLSSRSMTGRYSG